MLYESFWAHIGRDWRSSLILISALTKGGSYLKRYLATDSKIDPSTLPYDQHIITYIKAWRSSGGIAILVTASDQIFADAIAGYLQIFDEAHGSDGIVNLKGENKAVFLEQRFGKRGFDYMADARADLPVWERAEKAISVNVTKSLRREIEEMTDCVEHLITINPSAKPYFKALRPHQWLKNTLIFLPLLAAHQFDPSTIIHSIVAFISFSLIASSVYVVNDLVDLSADRLHPRKKKRPFASGKVLINWGTQMVVSLILLGLTAALFVSSKYLLVIICYCLLTAAYSLHIKRRIVQDIFMLAGLYTLRIIAGGVATNISLSVWLLAFSMFFFFSLAAVKRQAELVDHAKRGHLKATGRGYHIDDLPVISMIAIAAGYVSVLVLALYVNSPAVTILYAHPQALWGVCIVLLYWISSTVMHAHRGEMHDDPVIYAAKDRVSQICFLIILILVFLGSVF